MKKNIFAFLILSLFLIFDVTARRQINLNQSGQLPGHFELPVPADKPTVYYDDDTMEIIIDGPGYANYYNVNIESVSTGYVLISEVVNGYYDSIDISSLPADDYTITITSSNNNVFEGSFCIEE